MNVPRRITDDNDLDRVDTVETQKLLEAAREGKADQVSELVTKHQKHITRMSRVILKADPDTNLDILIYIAMTTGNRNVYSLVRTVISEMREIKILDEVNSREDTLSLEEAREDLVETSAA